VLAARNGDRSTAEAALEHATAHLPDDPIVLLNAAMLYDEFGADDSAAVAARHLLQVQPDIQSIAAHLPEPIGRRIDAARAPAAAQSMADRPDIAFLIALYGNDRDLAESVVRQVATTEPDVAATWANVTSAWFGDRAARASLDAEAVRRPTADNLARSWRLAVRDCDAGSADQWQRAVELAGGIDPQVAVAAGVAPDFQARQFPTRYPGVVWRMDFPTRPYLEGIWSFAMGKPPCSITPAG